MRLLLLAFVLLFAGPANAQDGASAAPLSGVWVPGELLRSLQSDAPREIPCYLVIEPSPELQVLEECGGGRSIWSGAVLVAEKAGRLEVRAGEKRSLIYRAGTPNELELLRLRNGEEPELTRLYRLPEALEERLRSWAAAQQILVGRWRTDDGAEVVFDAQGTYRFAQERGRFHLEPGAPVPGAWAVLVLEPLDGGERTYLLTGAGRRVGMAEPPPGVVEGLRAAGRGGQEAGIRPGAAAQEEGARPDGMQEEGIPPGGGAEEQAQPEASEVGAAAPAEEPPPLEVLIWLEKAGAEQQVAAPAAPVEAGEEIPAEAPAKEPPPIAQPIEPERRRCGCGAGEGLSATGLAVAALALRRLRRHPRTAR